MAVTAASFVFGGFSFEKLYAQNLVTTGVTGGSTSLSASNAGTGTVQSVSVATGRIPILEIHHIDAAGSRWGTSVNQFKNDLLWLYNNDYRLISLEDFVDGKIVGPAGKKPVILTFDDGLISQFKYLKGDVSQNQSLGAGDVSQRQTLEASDASQNQTLGVSDAGQLKIDPNCAVGILDDFYKQYPDFGRAATFFVNDNAFGQKDLVKQKFEYLYQTGRQIGYHTLSHTNLSKVKPEAIKQIFLDQTKALKALLPVGMRLDTIAYPFGGVPKVPVASVKEVGGAVAQGGVPVAKSNLADLMSGSADGISYNIKLGLLVGADPTKTLAAGVDPFRTPRIQGIDAEWLRHFGRKPGETARAVVTLGARVETFKPYIFSEVNVENVLAGVQSAIAAGLALPVSAVEAVVVQGVAVGTQVTVATQQNSTQVAKTAVTQQVETQVIQQIIRTPAEQAAADKRNREFLMKIYTNLAATFKKAPRVLIKTLQYLISYRGIYLTAYSAGSTHAEDILKKLQQSGGNLVVVDFKETDGHLYYQTQNEINKKVGGNNRLIFKDPQAFIKSAHEKGITVVARVVCFKDELMAVKKPEWAIHDFNGNLWRSPEGQSWLDPSLPAVQDYVISVAEEVAKLGVDEIQFDYVRFPTQGKVGQANYSFDEKVVQKYEIIRDFLKKAGETLHPLGVKVGIDVYGVVAWNGGYDSVSTGQKIEELAPYVDAIYPMVYPSHFGPGFAGHKNPANEPYFFVQESLKQFQKLIAGTSVELRPWLQGFRLRVTNFGPAYVQKQVDATYDLGLFSFVVWNAGNNYDSAWGAMKIPTQ